MEIASRAALKDFYTFLHAYVDEQITLLNFASSETLAAVEEKVRIEARRDLTAEALAEQGASGLFPMLAGDVLEMRQFVHYIMQDGLIVSVECAMLP